MVRLIFRNKNKIRVENLNYVWEYRDYNFIIIRLII